MKTRVVLLGTASLVGAYLVVLLSQLGSILNLASWNADNANMLNLARDLATLGDGDLVNMGNAPIYSTLWGNATLNELSQSQGLVEAVPLLWYLVGSVLLVWGVRRATDRLTAGATAAILVCLNPVSLDLVTSHAVHGPTWFTAAALSAYAVFLGTGSRRGRWLGLGVAVLAGLVAGVNTASDPLTAPVAVVPLLVAAAGVWWTASRERRAGIGIQAGCFLAVTVAAGVGSRVAGRATGITADLPPGNLATLDQMWASALQSADNAMSFFGPAPFGGQLSAFGAVRLVVGIAGLVGVIVAAVVAVRLVRSLLGRRAGDIAQGSPLTALRLFWGASVVVGLAAVLTSPLAFEVRESSLRYEFNLFLAAAVALPVGLKHWKGTTGRRLTVGLVALVAVVGIDGVLSTRAQRSAAERSAMISQGPRAIDYARDRGATRGYAGYWNAGPLRWHTGTQVLAVANCVTDEGERLCPTRFAVPPALLRPRDRTKSFVLIDHSFPGSPADQYLTAFGAWEERRLFGNLVLLIYPYDIGSRFRPDVTAS